jgi:outer membrane protein assembly factor BamB
MATMVTLFLMFAMAVSLVALPTATAQGTMKTYPYVGAVPNPVGVGQEVLIHVGITHELDYAMYGWEDLTVTVTKLDGSTETLGPFKTDATGGTGTVYVPDEPGNYTLQSHFPEQVCEQGVIDIFFGAYIAPGTVMEASDSDILTLVVQEESITYYPGHPLPTEYWTRPIDAQLREWSVIAGNWLTTPRNMYAPYNDDAPETAHILWTKPLTSGGLVGGDLGEHSYEIGDAYEGRWGGGFFGGSVSMILGGKLYYQKYANNDKYKETICVDLHTGEELWSKVFLNNLTLSFGQLMYWDTYDYHGVYDYLWATANSATLSLLGLPPTAGTTWCAFDPFTGDYVYTLYGIPSGTQVYGPKGEILIYTVSTSGNYMTLWNSSNIPWLYADRDYASMSWGQWQPMGKTVNATGYANVTTGGKLFGSMFGTPYIAPTTPLGLNGYQWNKTIPTGLPGGVIAVLDDRIIGGSVSSTAVSLWGLNSESGKEGNLLFKNTWEAPDDWLAGNLSVSTAAISSYGENGVLTVWVKEERQYYGFSLDTGEYLWKTAEPEQYLQIYVGTLNAVVDDKLYSTGVSGIVYCYDVHTGELLWKYHATDTYSEILWANDWWNNVLFITDGKVYLGHEEHSPIDPRPRGAPFICLNATTGEEIFRADGLFRQTHWGGPAIIGDSIIATMDTYDQRVYAIGKGPSATTVSIQNDVITHGSSVLVKGMVTDISLGTQEYSKTARFPSGVPAVADENMSDWMLYVYKQFERPADAVGVEVVLEVLDPNNNYYEVGRTTSDASGMFHCAFTPEVPGEYTIIATFAGSESYYGSFAETAINVEEAPAATPAPTPTPAPMTDTYVLSTGIAILIAVIIGFALLLLRKRP